MTWTQVIVPALDWFDTPHRVILISPQDGQEEVMNKKTSVL